MKKMLLSFLICSYVFILSNSLSHAQVLSSLYDAREHLYTTLPVQFFEKGCAYGKNGLSKADAEAQVAAYVSMICASEQSPRVSAETLMSNFDAGWEKGHAEYLAKQQKAQTTPAPVPVATPAPVQNSTDAAKDAGYKDGFSGASYNAASYVGDDQAAYNQAFHDGRNDFQDCANGFQQGLKNASLGNEIAPPSGSSNCYSKAYADGYNFYPQVKK